MSQKVAVRDADLHPNGTRTVTVTGDQPSMPSSRRVHALALRYVSLTSLYPPICRGMPGRQHRPLSEERFLHKYTSMTVGIASVGLRRGQCMYVLYRRQSAVQNARNHAVGLAYAFKLYDDIRVVAMSLVHLIGRCSLPVGVSHILPSFAGIAKVLPLFLSFCVSVSRHREGRPDTSSVR